MPTILLKIDGLHDTADERRLEAIFRAADGVYGAVVYREEGCAEIDVDDDVVTIEELIGLAGSAGFTATLSG